MIYKHFIFRSFIFLGLASNMPAFDPLERVEQDQSGELTSSKTIFNRNIAIGSRPSYTQVSSYKPGAFGHNAHDGNLKNAWVLNPIEKKGFIQISWGEAVPVDQVKIIEHKGGNIQSLKLELYNGREWTTIGHDGTSDRGLFNFPVRPASALRISLETNGGGETGIAEVEVYNTQSTESLPRYGTADLVEAMRKANAVILFDGSPYAYSHSGRALIQPRNPEASLADGWTKPVIEFLCASLGGKAEVAGIANAPEPNPPEETRAPEEAIGESEHDEPGVESSEQSVEPDTLQITLNGKSFSQSTAPGTGIIDQIQVLAENSGLEFLRQGHLVMIGQGVEALKGDKVVAELITLLGRNPYHLVEDNSPPPSSSKGFFDFLKSLFAEQKKQPDPDAIVTPTTTKEGITYEWVGMRSMADPDTNSAAWLKYSGIKAARSWVNSTRYMDRYIRPEKPIESTEEFESLKSQIRSAPETNNIIATKAFLNKHHAQLAAEFGIYNSLGIEVINSTGPKDWPDTLNDDFVNWASCYALTYYLAKNYGIAAHQYGNEPDWYFNQSTDEQIARRLTLVADAVHSAIEDVNRDHNRQLKAIFSAPVLAGDFLGRTARIMMQNLYTRYDGSKSPTPLFQLFNRHRYSGRPNQNAEEVSLAKQMMQEEAGEVLPQVFTELNYSTGRSWRNPATTFLNDTPVVFTAMASIWGLMMQEQGVYGNFIFKFNDSEVWKRDGTGPFSNTITYSMSSEQDPGAEPKVRDQISYGSKNFEVTRLFGKGFHGSRSLLKTDVTCADPEYHCWTTVDEKAGCYYLWSVQIDDFNNYTVEFDLSKLDLPPEALITAETVSGARHGEMTQMMRLPEDRKIRLKQSPQSAMLLTVHKRPVKQETIYPESDATVIQGAQSNENFGKKTSLRVGRHPKTGSNEMSFLKFKLPEGTPDIHRAVLELHGQSRSAHPYDGGFLTRVYAVEKAEWDENQITAQNAPNVCKTVSAMKKIDINNYPVGHVTCFNAPSQMMLDITQAVQEARKNNNGEVDLVLIREIYWPNENTEDVSAVLSSREAGQEQSPKLHLWE